MHPRRVEGTSQLNLRRDSKITCGLATVTFTFAFAVTDAVVVVFAFAKQFRSGGAVRRRLDPSSPPSLGASGDARRCGLGPRRRASRAPRRISEPRRAACVSHRLRPRGKLVVSPSPRKLRRNAFARVSRQTPLRDRGGAFLACERFASYLAPVQYSFPNLPTHCEVHDTQRYITSRANAPGDRLLAMQSSRRRTARPSPILFASTPAFASRRAERGDAWSKCSAR